MAVPVLRHDGNDTGTRYPTLSSSRIRCFRVRSCFCMFRLNLEKSMSVCVCPSVSVPNTHSFSSPCLPSVADHPSPDQSASMTRDTMKLVFVPEPPG